MIMDLGYNANRTEDLFALTPDGYVIAQDIACQHEYIDMHRCPVTDGPLRIVAQINRAFQGLTEIVAISLATGERFSFIFDISNDVYQMWLADEMGELYERDFEGPARIADPNQRFYAGA